jgi:hypothetical protein
MASKGAVASPAATTTASSNRAIQRFSRKYLLIELIIIYRLNRYTSPAETGLRTHAHFDARKPSVNL